MALDPANVDSRRDPLQALCKCLAWAYSIVASFMWFCAAASHSQTKRSPFFALETVLKDLEVLSAIVRL